MTKFFIKMYVDTIESGLIADIGPERWQTLCVLASFMDKDGKCYPSQDLLAQRLSVTRETANRRIQSLLKYRWKGEPIVIMDKPRESGRWKNNVYTISSSCGLVVFNSDENSALCDVRVT